MNQRRLRKWLQPFIGTRKKVRLSRATPCQPLHNGFVLGVGSEFVLLQQFHDFYSDGYVALRMKDITSVRSGDYERHWERMLAAEGTLDGVGISYDVPLQSMSALLQALLRREDNIIIECEDANEKIEDYYIGGIVSVDRNSVEFANFDGLGHWDKTHHTISFKEITKIQFETPYVKTFSKYLEGPCSVAATREVLE